MFQCLAHTLGMPATEWRVLATAHGRRNQAEYEGESVVDERLVADTIAVAERLVKKLSK